MHDDTLLSPLGFNRSSDCGYCNGQSKNKVNQRKSQCYFLCPFPALFKLQVVPSVLVSFNLEGQSLLCCCDSTHVSSLCWIFICCCLACAYFVSSKRIHPHFYKALIDRGWRRSGCVLYKPDCLASCCAQYAIRLDSHAFRPSRDQRHAQNRFNTHIVGDTYAREAKIRYPRSKAAAKRRKTEFDLSERVHESEADLVPCPPEPAHRFTVVLEPDTYTDAKYALFENYQRVVHHEPPHKIRRSGFRDFLCGSPLVRDTQSVNGREQLLGSYHQCYYIDGRLMAMAVLDLLPDCVSSVYFMYHEEVGQYNFGKLGALREIALARDEGYRWWYAGFYVHTCPKMRYKGDYTPQYLLDPDTNQWKLFDDVLRKKLDVHRFVSNVRSTGLLEDASEGEPEEGCSQTPLESPESDHVMEDEEEEGLNKELDAVFSIPGAMTKAQVSQEVDMGDFRIEVRGVQALARDLSGWTTTTLDDALSPKAIIGQLVAMIGTEVSQQMIVKFM